jgi:cystathionine beta-synthase
MAVKMIEEAERTGALKPGRHDHRRHVGQYRHGLAIAAVVKGYKCIFTTTDKQSKEKVDALKAFGAEVIVCPTDVDPEDPRSYYSVSSRLERECPTPGRPTSTTTSRTARRTTSRRARRSGSRPRPGHASRRRRRHRRHHHGVGAFSRSATRHQGLGIDTYGSVFKKYKETGVFDKNEIYPYITEGIGEDFLPQNVDFSVIDHSRRSLTRTRR